MPNNEERICIFKQNFDTNITEIEGPKYMTRAEAVERMALAICKVQNGVEDCQDCMSASEGQCELVLEYPLAEAALDALLGGAK